MTRISSSVCWLSVAVISNQSSTCRFGSTSVWPGAYWVFVLNSERRAVVHERGFGHFMFAKLAVRIQNLVGARAGVRAVFVLLPAPGVTQNKTSPPTHKPRKHKRARMAR